MFLNGRAYHVEEAGYGALVAYLLSECRRHGAAIHLGAIPPRLSQASLAIDAVGCLVEGLGERLGPEIATLTAALSNIRLAFVQIKAAAITEN